MKDPEAIRKRIHAKRTFYGTCLIGLIGIGLFIILLNIISRGGWFFALSILISLCLLATILYFLVSLFGLWLINQPDSILLDEKEASEKMQARKTEKGGIHIRLGWTKK